MEISKRRKLVQNVSFSPHDCCTCGSCPHCGHSINDYQSNISCQFCGGSIAWYLKDLSTDERAKIEEEAKERELEHNKKIKPCPFCGNSVDFPSIQISKAEKPYIYLSVSCFSCGIELTETTFKSDLENLNKANQRLIEKWNRRPNA